MSDPQPDWARLGRLLTQRRGQLGSEYLNRQKFCQITGLNERLVSDLENARRDGYRPATKAAVEQAYQWASGSIEKVLAGGDPTPLTESRGLASAEPADGESTALPVMTVERFKALVDAGVDPACPPGGFWNDDERRLWRPNSYHGWWGLWEAIRFMREHEAAADQAVDEALKRRDEQTNRARPIRRWRDDQQREA